MTLKKDDLGTIRELIEYGLDRIGGEEKIEIPLKDFAYLYKTIVELRRFFHNPQHYPDMEAIEQYVSGQDGMYTILNEIYIHVFSRMIDSRTEERLESDDLKSPKYPFYYLEKD